MTKQNQHTCTLALNFKVTTFLKGKKWYKVILTFMTRSELQLTTIHAPTNWAVTVRVSCQNWRKWSVAITRILLSALYNMHFKTSMITFSLVLVRLKDSGPVSPITECWCNIKPTIFMTTWAVMHRSFSEFIYSFYCSLIYLLLNCETQTIFYIIWPYRHNKF